jgi:D-alanyl-D-alanine carboxypeptidase (penicillin-binding protein 5/6)
MASIAKLVTALVVLDEQPLALGEQGPEYRFTAADQARMWQLNRSGESVLPVPVGGTLTQYQLLQGLLIGSAGNYAERLTSTLYPSPQVYARAANEWLVRHGVRDITIADPSGIGQGNTATPEALLQLGELAMAHPVIAEIVAQRTAELPGAGLVKNTNELLADPGVVGLKTGFLNGRNLLAAKHVTVGDTTVTVYAVVLDQPTSDDRSAATRALFDAAELDLQPYAAIAAGTPAGEVRTAWGEVVDVVLAEDAMLVGWNGSAGTATSSIEIDGQRDAGATVGEARVAGPLNTTTVPLELAAEINGPSPWWRLTHPLELLGLR